MNSKLIRLITFLFITRAQSDPCSTMCGSLATSPNYMAGMNNLLNGNSNCLTSTNTPLYSPDNGRSNGYGSAEACYTAYGITPQPQIQQPAMQYVAQPGTTIGYVNQPSTGSQNGGFTMQPSKGSNATEDCEMTTVLDCEPSRVVAAPAPAPVYVQAQAYTPAPVYTPAQAYTPAPVYTPSNSYGRTQQGPYSPSGQYTNNVVECDCDNLVDSRRPVYPGSNTNNSLMPVPSQEECICPPTQQGSMVQMPQPLPGTVVQTPVRVAPTPQPIHVAQVPTVPVMQMPQPSRPSNMMYTGPSIQNCDCSIYGTSVSTKRESSYGNYVNGTNGPECDCSNVIVRQNVPVVQQPVKVIQNNNNNGSNGNNGNYVGPCVAGLYSRGSLDGSNSQYTNPYDCLKKNSLQEGRSLIVGNMELAVDDNATFAANSCATPIGFRTGKC